MHGHVITCSKCTEKYDSRSICKTCNPGVPDAAAIKGSIWKDKYDPKKFILETDTHIIAKGGDGTLLRAINMHRDKNKPFLGIAGGTENFLMNKDGNISEDAEHKKFHLIKVNVTYKERDIHIESASEFYGDTIIEGKEVTKEYQAFNDVMFGGDMNSWIDFNVHDKDCIIGKFKGSGIVISTAAGTTGANKNNNGAILPLSSNNWSITGDKTTRKIRYVIEPARTSITAEARQNIKCWIDGANHIISNVSKIEVERGDVVTVIFNDYDEFKRKRRI